MKKADPITMERAVMREFVLADLLCRSILARALVRKHGLQSGKIIGARQCARALDVSDGKGWQARADLVDLGVIAVEPGPRSRYTWDLAGYLNRSADLILAEPSPLSADAPFAPSVTPEERRSHMRAV